MTRETRARVTHVGDISLSIFPSFRDKVRVNRIITSRTETHVPGNCIYRRTNPLYEGQIPVDPQQELRSGTYVVMA